MFSSILVLKQTLCHTVPRQPMPLSRRSLSKYTIKEADSDLRWFLQVPGLGVLTITVSSSLQDARGRLQPECSSILEIAEIERENQ